MIDLEDSALFSQAAARKEILLEGDTVQKTIELAGNAAAHVEGLTLRVLEQTDSTSRVACREGCSYCCHLSLEVAAPEALADARRIFAEDHEREWEWEDDGDADADLEFAQPEFEKAEEV
jgi:hypothetical protein